MPQLDHISFLTQYVWLSLVLGTLYHLFIQDGLTLISAFLKARLLLIHRINNSSKGGVGEMITNLNYQTVKLKCNKLFFNSFDNTFSFFKKYLLISSLWSKNAKKYTNKIFFMIIDLVFYTFFLAMSFGSIQNFNLLTSFAKPRWLSSLNTNYYLLDANLTINYNLIRKAVNKI
jgi:hypothetical protein